MSSTSHLFDSFIENNSSHNELESKFVASNLHMKMFNSQELLTSQPKFQNVVQKGKSLLPSLVKSSSREEIAQLSAILDCNSICNPSNLSSENDESTISPSSIPSVSMNKAANQWPTNIVPKSRNFIAESPSIFLKKAFEKNLHIDSPTPTGTPDLENIEDSYSQFSLSTPFISSLSSTFPDNLNYCSTTSTCNEYSKHSHANDFLSSSNDPSKRNKFQEKHKNYPSCPNPFKRKELRIQTENNNFVPTSFSQQLDNYFIADVSRSINSNISRLGSGWLNYSPTNLPNLTPIYQQSKIRKQCKLPANYLMKTKKKTTGKGLWSEEEHKKFIEGLNIYGRSKWKEIARHIGTRTRSQVASHGQKFFSKVEGVQNKK